MSLLAHKTHTINKGDKLTLPNISYLYRPKIYEILNLPQSVIHTNDFRCSSLEGGTTCYNEIFTFIESGTFIIKVEECESKKIIETTIIVN